MKKGFFSEIDSSSNSDEDQGYDLSDPDAMANTLQNILVLDRDEKAMEVIAPTEKEHRGMIQDYQSGSNDICSSESDTFSLKYRSK